MKVDSKTTIELESSDAKTFKSAIDKIANMPTQIGLKPGNDHNLVADEIELIKKLSDKLK